MRSLPIDEQIRINWVHFHLTWYNVAFLQPGSDLILFLMAILISSEHITLILFVYKRQTKTDCTSLLNTDRSRTLLGKIKQANKETIIYLKLPLWEVLEQLKNKDWRILILKLRTMGGGVNICIHLHAKQRTVLWNIFHILIEEAEAEILIVGETNEVLELNLDKYTQGEKRWKLSRKVF